MTVWIEVDGVHLAVTGELVKGITPQLDRFEPKRVYIRSEAQNVKEILREGFLKRLTAEALMTAHHPIPIPYDIPLGKLPPDAKAEGGQS